MQTEKIGDDLEVGTELPEVEVEIVDDTPEEDKGREPLKAEKDEQEDELENYSEKVQKRINQLNHRYHDERRAKEVLVRQNEEAIRLARTVYEENERLKQTLSWGQQEYAREAEAKIDYAQKLAEDKYRKAYETGDTDGVLEAQRELNDTAIQKAQLQNQISSAVQQASLQQQNNTVYSQPEQQYYEQPASDFRLHHPEPRDLRAEDWASRNPWFGKDEEMTSFAYGLHQKLVNNGIDPTSDEYYQKIDNRIREVFPQNFQKSRKSSAVAPASRSTGSKKVTLTASQVAIAKRLGVPLETYAKYAAKEMNNA
jgi:hypothetical protein